jgi:hypothetical protein
VLLVAALKAWAYESQPLTQCGQVLEGTYYLTGDLDCTGVPGHGVDLTSRRSRLELRGFTLSNASAAGVQCGQSCAIVGPGTISGSGIDGVRVGRKATIVGVTIVDNGARGVDAEDNGDRGRAIVENSHIEGNKVGVRGDKRVALIDSVVINNTDAGVVVDCAHGKTKVENSTVTGNGINFTCD